MRFDKFLIATIIISICLIGGVAVISNNKTSYNVNDTTVFSNLTSTINTITDDAESDRQRLLNNTVSPTTAEDNLFIAGYNLITDIWKYFTGVNSIISQLALILKIPTFITKGFAAIMLFSALFGVIYLIFRFQPRD